jgi:hypothetical protein
MSKVGFIILRHVNSPGTDEYWKTCYDCIRKYYSNPIVIIDDNSTITYITSHNMKNTIIINSEYPGRGELLPYYYYLKYKWFDTAVILHDSVFINKHTNFNIHDYSFLWSFNRYVALSLNSNETLSQIRSLKNHDPVLNLYNSKKFRGCFGAMMIVEHSLLKKIDDLYDFSSLLPVVKNRTDRMGFERTISCMFQSVSFATSMFGDIFGHGSNPFYYNYADYKKDKESSLPIIKVWSGR